MGVTVQRDKLGILNIGCNNCLSTLAIAKQLLNRLIIQPFRRCQAYTAMYSQCSARV